MYEYKCSGCGKKSYSAAELDKLNGNKECESCGAYISYTKNKKLCSDSIEQLKGESKELENIIKSYEEGHI